MQKIFITGASSGIGAAIAKQLCAAGHEVWGTSRDPRKIPSIERLHAVQLDLGDTAAAVAIFKSAELAAGYFDVVINNAGSGHFGPAETVSPDLVRDLFQTLVCAQIALTQTALRAMQERGSGTIINVTSLASRLPVPFMSAYNAAKAAMASFTMTLQLELRDSGVRVIDFQPGDIRTNFNDVVTKSDASDPAQKVALTRAWNVVDRNMKQAPGPEIAARRVLALIERNHAPPRITVGDFFQATIAPAIFRLLPQRTRLWGLKKYYRL